jgi:glycosyltransferase involved in cell wall biosynthesis
MKEVGGNAAEYFNPQETESLLQAFKNVLYSETRRKELVNLGKERIKIFSWDKCAKETLKVYSSLC